MGLFADLLAASDMAPAANPANAAMPAQAANPTKVASAPAIRRFAGFARGADSAIELLERFATSRGIDWTAARSQMIPGDAEAGAEQLAADTGDGIERAGVACWLRLLVERATPDCVPWPAGYRTRGTRLDAYRQPLPPACPVVTCGSCQHFQHDPINPAAGVGTCREGVGHLSVGGSLHPMAQRQCDHHESLHG